MRQPSLFVHLFLATLALAGMPAAQAQVCSGDVDGDGFLAEADLAPLTRFVFADPPPSTEQLQLADANRDRKLTVADHVRIVHLVGLNCSLPTTTPTPTATATPIPPTATASSTPTVTLSPTITLSPRATSTFTVTRTVTLTRTVTVTPTATAPCTVQMLQAGVTSAALTASDCVRLFQSDRVTVARKTDEYRIAAAPGQAIAISVTAVSTPGIVPLIRIVDAGGAFQIVEGSSPIEIVATVADPYEVLIASHPSSPVELGAYEITVTTRPCPTPEALSVPVTANRTLDNSECPDTALPSVGASVNPVDLFTFTVSSVPTNIDIVMRRVGIDSELDASIAVLGPDGFELFDPAEADDAFPGDDEGFDAQARFLATQAGTYTIVAASNSTILGGGGLEGGGRYSLTVRSPVCQPTALGTIPTVGTLTRTGMLTGNAAMTRCAAPLQMPLLSPDLPELNSASDLYSFVGSAGDLISINLHSDDDPQLYLFGPSSAGYPLLATDDDGALLSGGAQLAATLPASGTYLVVAANNFMLTPPFPDDPEDRTGDVVEYTLSLRRCSITGAVDPQTGVTVSAQFSVFDCRGFGDRQHRVYSFQGFAGTFVSVEMRSAAINSFVRLVAPNGSVTASEGDVFDPQSLNARVSRILPVDGFYFVEASRSIEGGDPLPDAPPAFTLRAFGCGVTTANLGAVSGSFAGGDCALADGRRLDVYRAPSTADENDVLSVLPPAIGCAAGLMADGTALPGRGCAGREISIPLVGDADLSGFLLAASTGATQGSYVAQVARCALPRITYGDTRAASLGLGSCTAADGRLADWILFRGPDALVRHNDGLSGTFTAAFASASEIADLQGPLALAATFSLGPENLIRVGGDRAVLLRITGAGGSNGGPYSLHIDPAQLRR